MHASNMPMGLYSLILSGNPSEELTFQTLSGDLKAKKQDSLVCLDLPLNTPVTLSDTVSIACLDLVLFVYVFLDLCPAL